MRLKHSSDPALDVSGSLRPICDSSELLPPLQCVVRQRCALSPL